MRALSHRFQIRALLCLALASYVLKAAPALEPSSSLQKYTIQGWNTENGLPQNSVHAMLQTSDGYFWMATEGGLARFNGYQFRVFDRDSTPRLPGNDIRCLFEDRNHVLWIGTSAGLTRMDGNAVSTYTSRDGLPSDAVRSILQTSNGSLWVLTAGGIASAPTSDTSDSQNLRFHSYAESDRLSGSIRSIVAAPGGGILAATDKGLWRVTNGNVSLPSTALSRTSIEAVSCDTSTCLIASSEGVFQLAGSALTTVLHREDLPAGGVQLLAKTSTGIWAAGKSSAVLLEGGHLAVFKTSAMLPGNQIESLFVDRRGAAWIGTDRGVARWWNGRIESAAYSSDSAALSMYEDRDGDLWLGTEMAGALELRDRVFEMLGRSQGLAEGAATSVVASGAHGLWVGTSAGGVSQFADGASSHRTLTLRQGLASDTILSLATDARHAEDLWIGTPDGLSRLQGGHLHTYDTADGLADDFARSLLPTSDGALWVGTRHGVTRWQDGHARTWTTEQGLGSDLVGAMVQDKGGDIWAGTLQGLAHIHDGTVRNFTVADDLPSDTITALANGKDGELWIGANGQGLAVRSGGRFYRYAAVPEIPKVIFGILEDDAGFLWLSSEHGLDRIALKDLAAYRSGAVKALAVAHYGTADGLGSSEGSGTGHPSAARLEDGRLCFATRRGVVVVDPTLLRSAHLAPLVVIERTTVDDRELSRQELGSVAPGSSHISFEFAGINLAAPQRVQYRYMMEGFDRDWVEAGNRRTAFYTNLPPGRYRFRVSARFGSEPWSEAGSSHVLLHLRPHFYQTSWFRAFLLCAFIAFLVGLYRLRLRTLQMQFYAVEAERNRLAREIHDTLAQGFVAVSIRLETLSRLLRGDRLDECRQQLNETRTLVQDGLAEARRSIWNLRTDTDRETLPVRLNRLIQQVVERGVDASLETTGAFRSLDASLEDELYRIAQESVSNALRHGDPYEIQIALMYTHHHLRLEIMDDGSGFDVATAPSKEDGHYGLTGLRERAERIGATLTIDSTPKRGTKVRVESSTHRERKNSSRS